MVLVAVLALMLYGKLESDDVSAQVIEEAHERAIQRLPVLSYPLYIATMKTCVGTVCDEKQVAVSKGPR